MPYSLGGWGILHWVPDVLSGPFQRLEVAHVALPRAQEYFRDLSLDKGVLTTKGKNVKRGSAMPLVVRAAHDENPFH